MQEECLSAGLPAFAAEVVRDWGSLALEIKNVRRHDDGSLEEEAATGLAKCLKWRLQYSVEVLSASRAASEYTQVGTW